jgi:hypothetical protein
VSLKKKKAMGLGWRLLRDVGIALAFLVAIALLVMIQAYTGYRGEVPVGWFGLAGFTPLVFWAVIKPLRMYRKRPTFWLAVAALLVVHLLAFVAVLLHYPRWPLLWFVPISYVEAALFLTILGKLFIRP